VRMAEILGVFASAVQLAQCALQIKAAISTIHSRVRDASELEEYATQTKQLLDTAVLIQHDRRLHTSSVIRHLDSAITEAGKLLDILGRVLANYTSGSLGRRYFKAARGGNEERKIAHGFRRLEQEKISLIFCIGIANTEKLSLNTEKLSCIQKGVSELAGRISTTDIREAEISVGSLPIQHLSHTDSLNSLGHKKSWKPCQLAIQKENSMSLNISAKQVHVC
jgi:hypothetical protein